jgi:hypothetical protein
VIKDDVVRLAISDIKNRWLHSERGTGDPCHFEHDCFDAIIYTYCLVQARASFKAAVDLFCPQIGGKNTIHPLTRESPEVQKVLRQWAVSIHTINQLADALLALQNRASGHYEYTEVEPSLENPDGVKPEWRQQ